MKAAVVSSFGSAPRYQEFAAPAPAGDGELLVQVLAAGLHPRVRSQADGSHYTSTGVLPLVPGIDGVGRGPDGQLRYFVLPEEATVGSMAEQTVIETRRSVVLPASTDPVAVAAAMNPAMSSWVALRQRTRLQAGQDVLVLGATGNAGRMAIGVARHLGAGRVIAAGRDAERLADLPADVIVSLEGTVSLGDITVAADVDIALDYLWGEPAVAAMTAILTNRADRSKPLTWIQIGAVAGATAAIPSAALRAARLDIIGSGQGSVSPREYLAELPALAEQISAGTFDVNASAVPLADVEQAWAARTSQRIVLVP
jgi:NADPH:quinone reductase-like Zn-dependent oxidoreductase